MLLLLQQQVALLCQMSTAAAAAAAAARGADVPDQPRSGDYVHVKGTTNNCTLICCSVLQAWLVACDKACSLLRDALLLDLRLTVPNLMIKLRCFGSLIQ